MSETKSYRLLNWDTNYFGYAVGRIDKAFRSQGSLDEVWDELVSDQIRLVFLFTNDLSNFNLPKGLVETGRRLHFSKVPVAQEIVNRSVSSFQALEPVRELYDLAKAAGGRSHLALDPRIGKFLTNGVYEIWMRNSLNGKMAQEVLQYVESGVIVGMVTLRVQENVGTIGLIAVNPDYRNRGIGSGLLRSAEHWFFENGISRVNIITQSENESAIALYQNMGYDVEKEEHTYHFWLM